MQQPAFNFAPKAKSAGRLFLYSGPRDDTISVDCPICAQSIEVVDSPSIDTAECTACGLSFHHRHSEPPPPDPKVEQTEKARDQFERWLSGSPIEPRKVSDFQLIRRWCRRRPYASALIASGLGGVTLAAVITATAWWKTSGSLAWQERRSHEAEQRMRDAEKIASQKSWLAEQQQLVAREHASARAQAERRRELADQEKAAAKRDLQLTIEQLRAAQKTQAWLERELRVTFAAHLAAESRQMKSADPAGALQLACEAMATTMSKGEAVVPAAEQAMREALAGVDGRVLAGHTHAISTAAISPCGRWLSTAGRDCLVRVWDLHAGNPAASPRLLQGHTDWVRTLKFSPDGRWMASAGSDKTICIWRMTPEGLFGPVTLRGHEARINALEITPDSRWLVTASGGFGLEDNSVRLWDLAAEDPSASPIVLQGHNRPVLSLAVSLDSRWLVSAGEDNIAQVWNLESDLTLPEFTLRGHADWITALAISTDSRWIVTASKDSTARLWNLTSSNPGSSSATLTGHEGWVRAAAFSPDNTRLATGSRDGTIRVWDMTTPDPVSSAVILRGHPDSVAAVTFTPDGRRLATSGSGGQVRLWDLSTAVPASILLSGHAGSVEVLIASPDGRWLATAAEDGTARLWKLFPEQLLQLASQATGRDLHAELSVKPGSIPQQQMVYGMTPPGSIQMPATALRPTHGTRLR